MSDTTLEKKVDKLLIDVAEIRIVLKGYNGNPGLLKNYDDLAKDYFRFKRKVLSFFFFMVGSGGLGLGIVKLVGMVK